MAGARGFVLGVLGLTLLQAVITSKTAPKGIADLSGKLAGGLARYLDPTEPLIPDLTGTTNPGASYTTTPPAGGQTSTV